jgi:hypothetical protein
MPFIYLRLLLGLTQPLLYFLIFLILHYAYKVFTYIRGREQIIFYKNWVYTAVFFLIFYF